MNFLYQIMWYLNVYWMWLMNEYVFAVCACLIHAIFFYDYSCSWFIFGLPISSIFIMEKFQQIWNIVFIYGLCLWFNLINWYFYEISPRMFNSHLPLVFNRMLMWKFGCRKRVDDVVLKYIEYGWWMRLCCLMVHAIVFSDSLIL